MPILREISEHDVPYYVYNHTLRDRVPKFIYFDEYHQMRGQDNLDALKNRVASNKLKKSDHPLLGLIDLAGLRLDQITDPGRTETLISRLEGAGNQLTEKVLQYWSQNRHLRMSFDIRSAHPEDPPDMKSGVNIWARVFNTKHKVTTALGTRSRGFIWFFSFLVWYSKLRKEGKNIILLLDEPGLSLHAKASRGPSSLFRGRSQTLPPSYLYYSFTVHGRSQAVRPDAHCTRSEYRAELGTPVR